MNASATLPLHVLPSLASRDGARAVERTLDRSRALDRFLREVEKRAFRVAQLTLRDVDDSLDAVQDAMLQLVRHYGARPSEEWRPLFYRILHNRVQDALRRRRTRSRVIAWWSGGTAQDEDESPDPIENAAAPAAGPLLELESAEALAALERALGRLPERQQQAFVLRSLEGLDVAQTAVAMGCSEGSVKTHYFRALQTLRALLGEHA